MEWCHGGHRSVIYEGDLDSASERRQIKLHTSCDVPAAFNQLGTTVVDVFRSSPLLRSSRFLYPKHFSRMLPTWNTSIKIHFSQSIGPSSLERKEYSNKEVLTSIGTVTKVDSYISIINILCENVLNAYY